MCNIKPRQSCVLYAVQLARPLHPLIHGPHVRRLGKHVISDNPLTRIYLLELYVRHIRRTQNENFHTLENSSTPIRTSECWATVTLIYLDT